MNEGTESLTARCIVEAIRVTDSALRKALGDCQVDLRRQRQELVDALCLLSNAEARAVNPPVMVVGSEVAP